MRLFNPVSQVHSPLKRFSAVCSLKLMPYSKRGNDVGLSRFLAYHCIETPIVISSACCGARSSPKADCGSRPMEYIAPASTPSVASPVQSAKSGASKRSSSPVSTFIAITEAMALSRLISPVPLFFPVSPDASNGPSPSHFAPFAVAFAPSSEVDDPLARTPCGMAEGCKAGKSLVMGMCCPCICTPQT